MSYPPRPDSPGSVPIRPVPLRVAALATLAEGVVYAVIGVIEWVGTNWRNPVVGLSTGLFFVLFGAFLVLCAARIGRPDAWPRAPIVMTQIIQVLVGISFLGPPWATVVAIAMFVVSAVVLAGIFHPASLRALAAD